MKKMLYWLPALVLGMLCLVSCSSDDDEPNQVYTLNKIRDIASRHSDNIDASKLQGGWQEIGNVYESSGEEETFNASLVEEDEAFRFRIIDDNSFMQYHAYQWGSDKRSIKVLGEYLYNGDSRQLSLNTIRVNTEKNVVEYLDGEYLILMKTTPYGSTTATSKRIFRRASASEVKAWENIYQPDKLGLITDYGVQLGEDNQWYLTDASKRISASQFQSFIVGHPLKLIEMHKILDDGSISAFDYAYDYTGAGPEHFLIDESNVCLIALNTGNPDYGPWVYREYPYTYDEANNRLNDGYPIRTILSYNAETEEVQMILFPFKVFAIYQRASMEWWKDLENQATKMEE